MAIGHYIHSNYENYLKYSLNTPKEGRNPITEEKVHQIFSEQIKNIHNKLKKITRTQSIDLESIEKQLNFYFSARKKNGTSNLQNSISDQDLKNMQEAIKSYLGAKLNNITIDMDRLSSAINSGNLSESIRETLYKGEKELEKELSRLSKLDPIGQNGKVSRDALKIRIETLLQLREILSKEKNKDAMDMKKAIDELDSYWNSLLKDNSLMNNKKNTYISTSGIKEPFIDKLNDIISTFLTGSSTVHGEYAEAIVVLTNYLANEKAQREVANLIGVLKSNVKGTDKSKKGLMSVNFDKEFVDLEKVIKGTSYEISEEDGRGNYFTAKETQDKVDIIIQIDDLDIPASVKNYDMSNMFYKDIHLLSGRSVLALVQDYDVFLNHFLNVASSHPDKLVPMNLFLHGVLAMKLTILLKALAGGVNTNKGKSQMAEILIINDNSQGKFKVFLVKDILDSVQNNIELLKTGDFDKNLNYFQPLNNNYLGEESNETNARQRISNLLNQLHGMSLQVSINKDIFLDKNKKF